MDLNDYPRVDAFDELIDDHGAPRPTAEVLSRRLGELPDQELKRRQAAAERALFEAGITFSVYSEDDGNTERIIPFDVIPRIIDGKDWDEIERGLVQRITALNAFVEDLYHDRRIIKDGVVPEP